METPMPKLPEQSFRVGNWRVQPDLSLVSCGSSATHLEPKAMGVLACLAEHAGEVVSKDDLIRAVWADTFVSDQVLAHAIWQLRQVLGNGGGRSEIIETIPKHGYRLVARVQPDPNVVESVSEPSAAETNDPTLAGTIKLPARPTQTVLFVSGSALLLAVVLGLSIRLLTPSSHRPSAKPVVAVLPLQNLSGDPEQAYLAEGMTEELTTDLAKISGLQVISRTSTMGYSGSGKSLPEIARELQVDAVVEGSVQRSGNRVRITAQLIDARSQQHMWAESYDRDFKDVLSIRDDVARAIAAEVRIKLTNEEKQRLMSPHPIDPQAYEAYLMGRYLATRGGRAGYEKSIEYFQNAVRNDPSYALAYAEMAESYAMLDFTADLRSENFRKAEEAAKEAAALDPQPAEVRIRMADLKMFWDWDWSQCDNGFREAARLYPGSADAQGHFATCLLVLGRYDEALQEEERAIQLDPLSPLGHRWLGLMFYNREQFQPAAEQFRKAIELNPNDAAAYDSLAIAYEALQQNEDAVSARTAAEALRGMSVIEVAALKTAFATGGINAFRARYREYKRLDLKKMSDSSSRTWVSPVRLAGLCVAAGDTDGAFKWLDKAYEHHSPQLIWLKSSIHFAPLRSDPRFNALLRRMNFPNVQP
jgi:TolB-like protein/DNA-binding winged helix-turn-helix (wHTH) protein/Tfp pilus assembly protein PilF